MRPIAMAYLSVTVNEDDTVSVRRSGNPNLPEKRF